MATKPPTQNYFDYVVDYIREIKPFHTKLVDTSIIFDIGETASVKVSEEHDTTIDFFFDQRNTTKMGFEGGQLDTIGLDLMNGGSIGDVSLNPYGYDFRRRFDQNKFDLLPHITISGEDLMLRGIDDNPLDFCQLDDPILLEGLDDFGFDGYSLDIGKNKIYALDMDGLDYTSFDDVYYDDISYNEGLVEYGYKNRSYGFDYAGESRDDHNEDTSPTTIRANITEKLVIDKSRITPVGFDFVNFDHIALDKLPSEIKIQHNRPFDPYSPFDLGNFDQTISYETTDPGTKTFNVFDVCDPLYSLSSKELSQLPAVEVNKLTANQITGLTLSQTTALLINVNITSQNFVSLIPKIEKKIINDMTKNQCELISADRLNSLLATLNNNDVVRLLNKLSATRLSNISESILTPLNTNQLQISDAGVFESVLARATTTSQKISLLLKTPTNKFKYLTSDILSNISKTDINAMSNIDVIKIGNIASVLDYPISNFVGLTTKQTNLLKYGTITKPSFTPTINEVYSPIDKEIPIYGTLGNNEPLDFKLLFNDRDITDSVTFEGDRWYAKGITSKSINTYKMQVFMGDNSDTAMAHVIEAPKQGEFLIAPGNVDILDIHLFWSRYENNMNLVEKNISLGYAAYNPTIIVKNGASTFYTSDTQATSNPFKTDGIFFVPTRTDSTKFGGSEYNDMCGLIKTSSHYIMMDNNDSAAGYVNPLIGTDFYDFGECIRVVSVINNTNISRVNISISTPTSSMSSKISDYCDLKLVIYKTANGVKTSDIVDLKSVMGGVIGSNTTIITLQKSGNYWKLTPST